METGAVASSRVAIPATQFDCHWGVLTEKNSLSWMVPYVPPLFLPAQILSLKQGRGCARYLTLRLCIKWQETCFFSHRQGCNSHGKVHAAPAGGGCKWVPWGALLTALETPSHLLIRLSLLFLPSAESSGVLLSFFPWTKPFIKIWVWAALVCLQSTRQDFLLVILPCSPAKDNKLKALIVLDGVKQKMVWRFLGFGSKGTSSMSLKCKGLFHWALEVGVVMNCICYCRASEANMKVHRYMNTES